MTVVEKAVIKVVAITVILVVVTIGVLLLQWEVMDPCSKLTEVRWNG